MSNNSRSHPLEDYEYVHGPYGGLFEGSLEDPPKSSYPVTGPAWSERGKRWEVVSDPAFYHIVTPRDPKVFKVLDTSSLLSRD